MQEEPGRRSLRGGGPGLVLPPPGPCSCSRPPPSLGLFLQTPALACLGFALPDPACSCVLLLVTSVTSPSLSTPSVPSRQPARLLTQPTLPWRELPPHPSSSLCSARVTSPWVGSLLPLLYTAQLSPGLQTTGTYQNLLEPSTSVDTSTSTCLGLAPTTVVCIVTPSQATPGVWVVVLICPHFQSPEVLCPVPVLIASGLVASPLGSSL